jgi:D-alanyl-lipoteichoic acid acyltransferase DltB (MBOAT superfamily)
MLFNSYQFIFGFLPAVCVSYFFVARFWGRRAGMAVLVAASLFFYGWWNDRYLWILLLSIGCNAGFAIALIRGEKNQRFWILLVGLGFNLLLLGYFKYASFFAANLSICSASTGKLSRYRCRWAFRSSPFRRSPFSSTPI